MCPTTLALSEEHRRPAADKPAADQNAATHLWHISSNGHLIHAVCSLTSPPFAVTCERGNDSHSLHGGHIAWRAKTTPATGTHNTRTHLFLDGGQDGGGGLGLGAVAIGGVENRAQHGGSAGSIRRHLRHWHSSWKTKWTRRCLTVISVWRRLSHPHDHTLARRYNLAHTDTVVFF